VTIAAADPECDVLPLTSVQIEGHEFATAADHGPILTNLNPGVDRIVFAAVRGPFGYQLGVTPELARHFIRKSKTDHLSLQENTTVPLKFHPKPPFTQMPNFRKNARARTVKAYTEVRLPQEETFMARPSVRIVVPDHLKNLLVDDWENVTKSLLVVPLPSKAPVNFIIDSYFDEEKGKRRLGSAEADVLEEFVAGMKVYFDKAIGKTLLYKFERPQWAEVCNRATDLTRLPYPDIERPYRFGSYGRVESTQSGMERVLVMLTVQSTCAECSVCLARSIICSLHLNNNH
jgi:hypothetical protein